MRVLHRLGWLYLALTFLLQSCSFYYHRPVPGNQDTPIFLPPTPVPAQPMPGIILPTETMQSTATLPCTDNLTYVSDLTIPDGSEVKPGAALDKRWETRNSGTCNWDERYSLRLVAGENLGVNEQLPLYPARSGTNLIIRITLQAPMQAGSYRSAWQAHNPSGEPFGDPIFIDITVLD